MAVVLQGSGVAPGVAARRRAAEEPPDAFLRAEGAPSSRNLVLARSRAVPVSSGDNEARQRLAEDKASIAEDIPQ